MCSCKACTAATRRKRVGLGLMEAVIGTAGFVLLADAGGWKLAVAFFLITWSANLRVKRLAS